VFTKHKKKGGEKMIKKAKAQSTVEYVLLLAAIVLAILYGITTVIAPSTENSMNEAGNIIDRAYQEVATASQ